MESILQGHLSKMVTELNEPVDYYLRMDDESVHLNQYLGKSLRLLFHEAIHCIHCGRKTKKSFSQGYCFPCMQKLAQCDRCIMSPELCHYEAGTCREPEWGETFCMQDHIVYLANSSGIKVGITRVENVPSRWIDQGAVQAVPILRVKTRYQSGLVEVVYKTHVSDRTQWQRMLKGGNDLLDMAQERDRLASEVESEIADLQSRFGLEAIQPIDNAAIQAITYPVIEYPQKVSSMNFDKQADIQGTLMGIKAQYLIFDTGVLNIRKFSGYEVELFA